MAAKAGENIKKIDRLLQEMDSDDELSRIYPESEEDNYEDSLISGMKKSTSMMESAKRDEAIFGEIQTLLADIKKQPDNAPD